MRDRRTGSSARNARDIARTRDLLWRERVGRGLQEVTPEAGALALWHSQLEAGVRTVLETDEIWRAACLEASARDALRDGSVVAANEFRVAAAEIVVSNSVLLKP